MHDLIVHFEFLRLRLFRRRSGIGAIFLLIALLFPVRPAGAAANAVDNQKIDLDTAEPYASPTNGLGSWIWEEKTFDNQTCNFWRVIDVPKGAKVAKSQLVMTADNEFTLYLDGQKLGHGVEWRELYVFDLTPLLTPGRHVLAVDAYNGAFFAGMLLGLRIDLTDGQSIEVKSDKSWKIIPSGAGEWKTRTEAGPDWTPATIIAPYGGGPWLLRCPDAIIMMPLTQPLKIFFWQTGWFQVSLLSVCGFLVLTGFWLMAQLALHRKERHLLEAERARIARDIHDDLGSRMTQLVVHGEVTQNELPPSSELRPRLVWICEEVRGLLSSMDEILWAVNPQHDTLSDFADYVCNYAQEFLKSTSIQCLFDVDVGMPATVLNLPVRRSLLMAIKEALNNAVKHSQARELHLKIQWKGSYLLVVVQDNGKGFDLNVLKPERHGVTNMTQRLKELGGTCHITSSPGKGCRVEFSLPLKHRFHPLWSKV